MDLVTYLQSLPHFELTNLYSSPWTCLAVLRALPAVAKQYVLRLLCVSESVTAEAVKDWIAPEHVKKHETAMSIMLTLQGNEAYQLSGMFRDRLRTALGRGTSALDEADRPPARVLAAVQDRDALERHARQCWDLVLSCLVSPASSASSRRGARLHLGLPALDIPQLLAAAGLLRRVGSGYDITGKGFEFLFSDVYGQLWALLQVYMADTQQHSGADLSEVVSFLLQLGFQRPGSLIRLQSLTAMQQQVAAHMAQLGLLYAVQQPRQCAEVWLCPTELASCLTRGSSAAAGGGQASSEGYIIVETNFRVYGYTTSRIAADVLQLFARGECLLPNLFVGSITNKSISDAMAKGISAERVIQFLRKHAHPSVRQRVPTVPEAVADQIRLWEADLNRVQPVAACLYEQFDTGEMFRSAVERAKQLGAHLWSDGTSLRLVAAEHAHDAMLQHIRRLKNAAQDAGR